MTTRSIFSPQLNAHYRSIIRLGVPIIIGQLGIILVGILDNVMVGRFATEDLAAASFVNSVFSIPIFFGLGFAYGLTPLVGEAFGRRESGRSGALLKSSLLLNLVVGLLLAAIMTLIYLNVERMGQPEELIPLIKPYYLLQLASLPFVMLFNAFKQFSEGVNNSKMPMYVMLAANGVNLVGNALFIYGVGDLPAMGVVGAGIATLASRIFMFIAIAYIFLRSDAFKEYREAIFSTPFQRSELIPLGRMGSMIGLQMGMETTMFGLAGIMVGWLGKVELASHQVLVAISSVGFMVYYGIGAAISVRVSVFSGQQDVKNIALVGKAGANIVMTTALAVSVVLLISRQYVALIFTSDVAVIDMVSMLIFTLVAYQAGDALQVSYANALRGLQDVKAMAAISFVGYFVIALPVSYICGFIFNWGLQGVWIGYPVGLTIAGLMLWWRFKQKIACERA